MIKISGSFPRVGSPHRSKERKTVSLCRSNNRPLESPAFARSTPISLEEKKASSALLTGVRAYEGQLGRGAARVRHRAWWAREEACGAGAR
ncbi:hypothetical protein ES332_D10G187400v1 [Gossypium tomentosum]|uniref:Uncharacterized protein n=1 Tax=Gossypium tomentosum TaxID=34277 RepID=A0A5D2J5M5_GOSTO|nr:hypothetical protein ES332_D10G187400v1 [Gossypium tomentosum]